MARRVAARRPRSSLGGEMRLAKYLAHAGVASRRAAERLIADGRVSVGGDAGHRPRPRRGRRATTCASTAARWRPSSASTSSLNKPVGVVSTASDPQGRPTVTELVDSDARLYPVGRLDADSSGLVLLTNDGELANRLMHPRYEVPRTYRVRVSGSPSKRALQELREGVELEDGRTSPGPRPRRRRRPGVGARGHDPRGPQQDRAAHVRGGRIPRALARARRVRPAGAGPAARRRLAAPAPARARAGAARGRPRGRAETIRAA